MSSGVARMVSGAPIWLFLLRGVARRSHRGVPSTAATVPWSSSAVAAGDADHLPAQRVAVRTRERLHGGERVGDAGFDDVRRGNGCGGRRL